ncbi:phage regulatory CII family protein [Oharaeibacter diazotrophicus]|uniref:Uncharacterized protein n=2 Tax=Oharaeibacter diazotrophicus TaxID=1920512 RepID=A0A4R6RGE5_9HYPH|nr:phage regulatory CII family protein [Oharaeibacter diazotrophicus]TDP85370.1 hypothetical protein EDD54_2223 [Oharaeibacter diazotrophicus]BBE74340.1 hypothetical protein OHA_1_03971 [Pleomorphomonas sp. SM30]GLS75967.1 hypothetical protein GCM10007904_13020 [Oharaeibacter diazotrophicus]
MHQDQWLYRLKAATRDLVTLAGGFKRAAEVAKYSKSNVERWANTDDGAVIPLTAAMALERETGQPLVTEVMAEHAGRALTGPDGAGGQAAGVWGAHATAIRAAAEAAAVGAEAMADGRLTPAELAALERSYSELDRAVAGMRSDIAAARGGLKVVGG